jgi:hypothetical protein
MRLLYFAMIQKMMMARRASKTKTPMEVLLDV